MSARAAAGLDAKWLAALRGGNNRPPLRPRLPLLAGGAVIGSVEPDFLSHIALEPLSNGRNQLSKREHMGGMAWHVLGDASPGLEALGFALRDAGLAHVWRGEQLAVTDTQGRRIGTVERAVVRALGIQTHAVHLLGQAEDGRFWVQQRALNKANDPGLLDTLMGGMVGAADTLASALERETWEEAGLTPGDLKNIVRGGQLDIRRPCEDGTGSGYVMECIDWYRCTVPDGKEPVNQDGEVERFVLMDAFDMLQKMRSGEFTPEAALIQGSLLFERPGLSSRA